jgi:hypothetical protein
VIVVGYVCVDDSPWACTARENGNDAVGVTDTVDEMLCNVQPRNWRGQPNTSTMSATPTCAVPFPQAERGHVCGRVSGHGHGHVQAKRV